MTMPIIDLIATFDHGTARIPVDEPQFGEM